MNEAKEPRGTQSPSELARIATERGTLYRLLATVFRAEPTTELVGHILSAEFRRGMSAAGVDTEALSALTPDDRFMEKMSLEYSRLFMGPGTHVPPYESVHVGKQKGLLWGPETSAVKKFIEAAGFAYDPDFHGLPDHISVELEFMAHLTDLEAETWRLGDQEKAMNCLGVQREFLTRHLGRWLSSFAERVADLAEIPVYPQMAALAREFVKAEIQELAGIDG